jgi:PAS domain S-box-containing protein
VPLLITEFAAAALLASMLLTGLLYFERRRRKAIARQDAVLHTLTHNLPDTVMLLDPMQRVQFANRPLPGGRSDVIGRLLREVVPGAAAEVMSSTISDAIRERRACEFDASWPVGNGDLRIFEQRITPVLEGDHLIGVTLQSSEVTVRRRFEEVLHLEAQILDTMNEGVMVIDASQLIVFANAAMHLLLGYASGDLQGRPISQVRLDELVPRLWARLLGKVPVSDMEIVLRRRDGSDCLVSLASSPLGDRVEKFLICVCRDISGQRRVERAIAGETARQAAGVGNTLHEALAQELTGVSLLLASLTGESHGKGAAFRMARDYLADAIRTACELAKVVSPTAPVRGSLNQALASLCADLGNRLGIPVIFHAAQHSADIEMMMADQLYRIAREILDNAIERRDCAAISIALSLDTGGVRLRIQWTGRLRAAGSAGATWDLVAYRVRLIGGSFECEDSSDLGGLVLLSAPLSTTSENPNPSRGIAGA